MGRGRDEGRFSSRRRRIRAVSDLFDVKIEQVSGATVRAHVDVVHPDVDDLPRSKNEAVQMILDGYNEVCGWPAPYWPKPGCKRDATLDGLVEVFTGRSERIDQAEYEKLEARARAGERLPFGLSMQMGTYWKRFHPDVAAALETAERLVTDVHVEQARNAPRKGTGGPHPEGIVVFTVADTALVAHLAAGMTWSSAMYDLAIDLPEGSAPPPPPSGAPPAPPGPGAPPAPATTAGDAAPRSAPHAGCAGCAIGADERTFPGIGTALLLGVFWLRTRRARAPRSS